MARASLSGASMPVVAHALTLLGLASHAVPVEVESTRGTADFHLVGLAEATVREARVRVRSALANLGVHLHSQVVTVNLAPADLRKAGSGFDLAIAVAILGALGRLAPASLEGTVFLGELSLSGAIRGVRGVLPLLLGARGFTRAVVPRTNAAEGAAARARGIEVFVAESLEEVVGFLAGKRALDRAEARSQTASPVIDDVDLAQVRGQASARRALEIAAAGGHDLLMLGPPGAGKTMLARRIPTILPPLTEDEALEATAIHSVAGTLPPNHGVLRVRPFRAPHHTASDAGLLGGGDPPRPGELSLAHAGVLFLDELPEFRRPVLEGLRQPLEDGVITISRARSRVTFPARPLVVAAMNPCPCGYAGTDRCRCSDERVRAYRARISGPIVDRLDLHVVLPAVDVVALAREGAFGEPSADVRTRVLAARDRQSARGLAINARINVGEIPAHRLDTRGTALVGAAIDRLGLSARAFSKIVRVARTIADLEGAASIAATHVAEAIQYRVLDRRTDMRAA